MGASTAQGGLIRCRGKREAYNYAGQNPVMRVDPTGLVQIDSYEGTSKFQIMLEGFWDLFDTGPICENPMLIGEPDLPGSDYSGGAEFICLAPGGGCGGGGGGCDEAKRQILNAE